MKSRSLLLTTAWCVLALAGCGKPQVETAGVAAAPEASYAEAKADASKPANSSLATEVRQRSIIRTASISVKVPDLKVAEKEVLGYIKKINGYLSSSETTNLTATQSTVTLTVRVPVAQFDAAVARFEELGIVTLKNISSEDITSQIVDLTARLKVMRAQEDSLLLFLKKSTTVKDSLQIQDRIMSLRQEIESMESQLRTQSELADLSTITVSLYNSVRLEDENRTKNWAQESWTHSTNALGSTTRGIGRWAIGLIVFAPIWGPIVAIVGYLLYRARRGSPTPPNAP